MAKAEAEEEFGSDRAQLKRLLKLAKDQPVHMALAAGADGQAIVKLDKLKQPRALEKGLKEAEGSKNHRFGTVVVDPNDAKTVKFVVNKAVGGFARKLVIALKGTGFNKVKIVMEDGSAVEDAEGEEEEEEVEIDVRPSIRRNENDGVEATARRAEAQSDEIFGQGSRWDEKQNAPPNDDMGNDPRQSGRDEAGKDGKQAAATQQDGAALAKELTGLVKQMLGVISKNPSQKAALTQLATDAQANLKRGDLDQASASIDILRQAMDDTSGGANGSASTPAAAPANGQDHAGHDEAHHGKATQKLRKSHAAWTATRGKVDAELQKLSKAIMAAGEGEDLIEGFEDKFFAVVNPVLETLDEELSDMLSRAADADAQEREELMQDARRTLSRYMKFVQSNDIIGELDKNPFVPLGIGKVLTGTLNTLSGIIR